MMNERFKMDAYLRSLCRKLDGKLAMKIFYQFSKIQLLHERMLFLSMKKSFKKWPNIYSRSIQLMNTKLNKYLYLGTVN